ncbi:MAG: hypothetical protein ACOZAR_03550 [Patescibacteria group bacterium]
MSKEEIKQIDNLGRNVFQDKVVLINFVVLLVVILITWLLWVVFYRNNQVMMGMPDYFSFLQQNQFLSRYVLPIFGSVVAITHLIIALFSYRSEKLVTYFLLGSAIFIEILITITVIYYMSYV